MNTSKRMLKRILIMAVVIIFLMTTTVARVFYLTIVRGEELSEKAETQQLKDTEITAMRGTIYDSNGNVLAQSASVWNVFIDPLNIKDKQRDLIVDEFANLFGYDADEKKEFYDKTTHQNHYELVEKKVENNIKEKLQNLCRKTNWAAVSVQNKQQKDIILTAHLLQALSVLQAQTIRVFRVSKLIMTNSLQVQTEE